MDLASKNAAYHNDQGLAYQRQGQMDAAIASFHQALSLNPNYAPAYNNLAVTYYRMGRITDALPQLQEALFLQPNYADAHLNLGNCYLKLERPGMAIPHYTWYLEHLPHAPAAADAAQNLAMAYVLEQDWTAALPLLQQAVQRQPQLADLQAQLGEVYLYLGQAAAAKQHFQAAVELDLERPRWLYNLAILEQQAGNLAAAQHYLTTLLAIEPNNHSAQHLLFALNASATQLTPGYQIPTSHITSLFDQYAPHYNQHLTQQLAYHVPALLRTSLAKVTSFTRTVHVLDLGCGTGLCCPYFRDIAKTLVGIDLSFCMLQEAKRWAAYDLLCCGNILAPLPGSLQGKFQLVLAADVLNYVAALEPLFTQLEAALAPAGQLLFSIELPLPTQMTLAAQPFYLQNSGRFAHQPQYIQQLAEQYGYSILQEASVCLRQQAGQAVMGMIFVLQKQAALK
jgi:predicted TPR repeat methyltransferase